MKTSEFLIYLAVMAGVTYLVRALPFVLVRKKIRNRFLNSFLHYIPYTVLTAMTVPAIFSATGSILSAAAAFTVAVVLAFRGKSLLTVALAACVTVFLLENFLL